MSIVAVVLLACALLVVIGAEWPRMSQRVGTDAIRKRSRARRRRQLEVLEGGGEGDEDFAASVERDLANLPVIDEPDRDRK